VRIEHMAIDDSLGKGFRLDILSVHRCPPSRLGRAHFHAEEVCAALVFTR
jgi:hypothetical protein